MKYIIKNKTLPHWYLNRAQTLNRKARLAIFFVMYENAMPFLRKIKKKRKQPSTIK